MTNKITNTQRENNIKEMVDYHFHKRIRLNASETSGYTYLKASAYQFGMFEQNRFKDISGVVSMVGMDMIRKEEHKDDKRTKLATHCLALYKKYGKRLDMEREDFIGLYSVLFIEALMKIDEIEPIDTLLANEHLYNTRLKYIKSNIDYEMMKETNPETKVVHLGKDENGDEVYKKIKIETDSINKDLVNGQGEVYSLINELSKDNELFTYGDDAYNTHYIQWFLENKERLLTPRQLKFFESLKDIYVPSVDSSRDTQIARREMFDDAGMNYDTFRKIIPRIKKSVQEQYEKEFGDKVYSTNYSTRKTIRDAFNEYVELADSPKWETATDRQIELSKIVQKYYASTEFEVVILKGLTTDEKIEVVRTVKGKQLLSHRLLRVIKNNIVEHLEKVEFQDIKVTEFKHKYSERIFDGLKEQAGKVFSIDYNGSFTCVDRNDIKEDDKDVI